MNSFDALFKRKEPGKQNGDGGTNPVIAVFYGRARSVIGRLRGVNAVPIFAIGRRAALAFARPV